MHTSRLGPRACIGPLIAAASLAGCLATGPTAPGAAETTPSGGGGPGLAERLAAAVSQSRVQAAARRTHPYQGTPLEGLFKRYPITNQRNPETWPRVAITITSATPGVTKTVGLGDAATYTADDCIGFSVRVWESPAKSQAFDNLRLCGLLMFDAVKGIPLYQIPTWGRRNAWVDAQTTGARRTDGPLPPTSHFPTDARAQNNWLDSMKNSVGWLGALMVPMGYDWNQIDDRRVWIVSVPETPR